MSSAGLSSQPGPHAPMSERGFMERFLVALDCMPGCTKIIDYILKVLSGSQACEFVIFHVLATESPDKLRRGEVQRIKETFCQA